MRCVVSIRVVVSILDGVSFLGVVSFRVVASILGGVSILSVAPIFAGDCAACDAWSRFGSRFRFSMGSRFSAWSRFGSWLRFSVGSRFPAWSRFLRGAAPHGAGGCAACDAWSRFGSRFRFPMGSRLSAPPRLAKGTAPHSMRGLDFRVVVSIPGGAPFHSLDLRGGLRRMGSWGLRRVRCVPPLWREIATPWGCAASKMWSRKIFAPFCAISLRMTSVWSLLVLGFNFFCGPSGPKKIFFSAGPPGGGPNPGQNFSKNLKSRKKK